MPDADRSWVGGATRTDDQPSVGVARPRARRGFQESQIGPKAGIRACWRSWTRRRVVDSGPRRQPADGARTENSLTGGSSARGGFEQTEAMAELDAIRLASRPASVASLTSDLRGLGLSRGATVIVHSSLSRLGYVAGGSQAVVLALLEAIGTSGTLIMPTHSSDLSDPAAWRHPPVPEEWWEEIRASMPAFDPDLTPTRRMGSVVECFRHLSGVRRSNHPTVSAAALGPNAGVIVTGHALAFGLGESSPQARLYDLNGWVLLLGVSHANNTSLHLAEYRSDFPNKPWTVHSSPVVVHGQRKWV